MEEVRIVTIAAVPGSGSTGSGQPYSRLARWAVGLSLVSGAMIVASLLITAMCAAVGADTAGIGMLLVLGVPGALGAFVLGAVAKARHERWRLSWLPLSVFPATVLYLVLALAFLWE